MRKSIIIIDDELLIRDLLYDHFSEKEWIVSVSESGEKSLELLRNRAYDIALVDIKMPDMDGLSFVAKIRDLYPTLQVVLMTGFPTVESAIEALRLKVDDYFIKPFNINKLYKTIDSLVERCKRREEKIPAADIQVR
jgi:DNA-binding response OmpR family regulator